jgi:hypothetical protein
MTKQTRCGGCCRLVYQGKRRKKGITLKMKTIKNMPVSELREDDRNGGAR